MARQYGNPLTSGGYDRYLSGNDRIEYMKKKHTDHYPGSELHHVDRRLNELEKVTTTVEGEPQNVPTVAPVLNEVALGGISAEAARTLTNENVPKNRKRSNIRVAIKKY
jgi:hypothetical protein